MMTPAQQDYLETIYRLEKAGGHGSVRVSDIAASHGTRLPTVTRTVRKLTETGYVNHDSRQAVRLTPKGRRAGAEILHRHHDLVRFFVDILGLPERLAQRDTCQIEHGLSGRTAQRLHEFLEYFGSFDEAARKPFRQFLTSVTSGKKDFRHLPEGRTEGWRT